jgi:hypothetical protein
MHWPSFGVAFVLRASAAFPESDIKRDILMLLLGGVLVKNVALPGST